MTVAPEQLPEFLNHDPESGRLFWRARRPGHFQVSRETPEWACNKWNSIFAGREAFTTTSPEGYKQGQILGKTFLAHRVIWALVHREWPEQIDHVNGDRADNRLSNLRSVSASENMRNQRLDARNKSGNAGVRWEKRRQVWRAQIGLNGRTIFLGNFTNIEDAIAARKAAEARLGFHPNHGRKKA